MAQSRKRRAGEHGSRGELGVTSGGKHLSLSTRRQSWFYVQHNHTTSLDFQVSPLYCLVKTGRTLEQCSVQHTAGAWASYVLPESRQGVGTPGQGNSNIDNARVQRCTSSSPAVELKADVSCPWKRSVKSPPKGSVPSW